MTAAIPIVKAVAAAGGWERFLALFPSDLERMILPYLHELWLRPDQILPDDGWLWYMLVGGRGWGKSHAFACYVNRQVELGVAKHVALMSTNAQRVEETQIRYLIELAPPWFKPVRSRTGLEWPNGVRAHAFTPEAPQAVRSENIYLSWLSEIVAWPAATRLAAFDDITTATRRGKAQVLIDTTASGRNDVRKLRMNAMNAQDPRRYRMIHGAMTDNPLLPPDYLRSEFIKYGVGSRRFLEEVMGESFDDAAGALWTSQVIADTRVPVAPDPLDLVILSLDPSYSDRTDADETGLILAGRKGRDVYILRDLSGRIGPRGPKGWGELVCYTAKTARAAGVVIEANSTADAIPTIIEASCRTHGLTTIDLHRDAPFPPYRPNVLYLKTVISRKDKYQRAVGPAGESMAGRLHIVGDMPELEHEMCTHEPESKDKSPGRLDAMVHATNELAALTVPAAVNHSGDFKAAADATRRMGVAIAAALGDRRVM